MNYFSSRQASLLKAIQADAADGFLVTNPVNVRYLTGFTGSSAAAVVTGKHTLLITDGRYEEQVQQECPATELVIRPHTKPLLQAAGEVLNKASLKTVAVEAEHLTLAMHEELTTHATKATLMPTRQRVEALRARKDSSELEAIRKAIGIAERAFKMLLVMMQHNDTERTLVNKIEEYMRLCGADGTAFRPIIAIGDRSAFPHAPPTERVLSEGSKVLIDWGADLGYKSDLTRTLVNPFAAAPTRKSKQERVGYSFEQIYTAVLYAHKAAVQVLRAGAVAKDVDAAARKALSKHSPKGIDLSDCFTHGLGHGIGLDIHEGPSIRQGGDVKLEAGNVVTIEPGVYIPGWGGIRIEDDYLITRDGATQLTTLPYDMNAIG